MRNAIVRVLWLLVSTPIIFVLWFIAKLTEDAVFGWVNSQLASEFGIVSPTGIQVATNIYLYGLPVAGGLFFAGCAFLLGKHYYSIPNELRGAKAVVVPAIPTESAFISMREAGLRAYERLRGTDWTKIADRPMPGKSHVLPEEKIVHMASVLKNIGLNVYGKQKPVRDRELIDPDNLKSGVICDEGNSFRRHTDPKDSPTYTELEAIESEVIALIDGMLSDASKKPTADYVNDLQFQMGFTEAAMDTNPTPENAKLHLAKLRSFGVALRNGSALISDDQVNDWLKASDQWCRDVADALEKIDETDAEMFRTLDLVPAARVNVRHNIVDAWALNKFTNKYNQHDYRLKLLREYLDKYRSAR